MDSRQKQARTAGLVYLIVVFGGLFGVFYVPSKIIVPGDAAATAHNILQHPTLYTINIVSSVVITMLFFLSALLLYRLLRDVNRDWATLMATLVAIQVPFGFVDIVNWMAASTLVRGAEFLAPFTQQQREALAMLFFTMSDQATSVAEILWGLWLLPLGLLVYRSGFLPRWLGIWLLINGVAYVILCFTALSFPGVEEVLKKVFFPAMLGELVLILWLVVMGSKPIREQVQA